MSRFKVLLVALVALLAVSACASAVASAEYPELRSSSFPIKYSGTIPGALWEVPGSSSFKCIPTDGSIEGEITAVNKLTAVMRFTGCKAAGVWCTSEGASTGEIVTRPLEANTEYLSNLNHFGIVFKPTSGVDIANFKCNGNFEVKGVVISTCYAAKNKPTSTLELGFTQAGGKQIPSWYYNTEVLPAKEVSTSFETNWPSVTFRSLGWSFNTTLKLSEGTVEPRFT